MELKIKNLNYKYSNKIVLDNISFTLNENECLIIQGHNGAGKTTLINCIIKNNKVSNGKIFFDNVDINKFKNWSKIGVVPQIVDFSNFPVSVFEFLTCYTVKFNKNKVNNIMDMLNLSHLKNENVNSLSGGQKRRVFIARALVNDIELLLLDEPVVAVDKESRDEILKIIEKIKQKGIPSIIITHNYNYFKSIGTKVMLLENKINFYGTKDEFDIYNKRS